MSPSASWEIWCQAGARPPKIGYYLRRDGWGHGYAARTLTAATEWPLGDEEFSEVALCTQPEYERSQGGGAFWIDRFEVVEE